MENESTDEGDWFEHVRMLTPSLAAAQAAAQRVGLDPKDMTLDDLKVNA